MLESLQFNRPPRDVRLIFPGSDPDCAHQKKESDDAVFERGRREGERALSEQLLRQRAELLELQNGILRSLRELMPQLAREMENVLVGLALEAAQKVVAGLPITSEMVEAAVHEALSRAEETRELTLLLNADDLELLQRVNSPLLLKDLGGDSIRLESARNVSRGGCIVQTRFGTIDARRETKLELLRKALEV